MSRPFLPFARPDIGDAEIEAVVNAMRSGWLTTGPVSAAFEREFADFLGGDRYAIAVNSATAGLHLGLEAIGVSPGDEVLVPTWTFTATAEAVSYLGGTPVLVDVDPVTLCIDFADAERRVTDRTVAIAPVHYSGLAVPASDLSAFARRHGLRVVEDAAHALPTINEGALVGAGDFDATVFSFYATKTITTGEGGMVVTRDQALAERMRVMRLHGIDRDVFNRYSAPRAGWSYDVIAAGFKHNLTDTAAALGRVQLRRAPEMARRRAEIAARYHQAFAGLPVELPPDAPEGSSHCWHLYNLRLTPEAPISRDGFIERMTELGVGTSVHFIPLHLLTHWRDRFGHTPEDFPVASAEFERCVSLPIFSAMTDDDIELVISCVSSLLS
ncbi:MAG: DegT/DnrJ/EryC1/StrS family aminotransferase [Propionibacteriaceae bacterium]|nr:DegT/DnrJ/EryC1/StrS family aminotransferase [Propionibacteriaceae bacterium]